MKVTIENELKRQIEECYKTIPGLRWSVSDYFRVIKTFMIMYQKTHCSYHHSIPIKKMPYILKSLQTCEPYEICEMIEAFFNMPLAAGKHHTIYNFCSMPIKRRLYYKCFIETKKRG